MDNKQEQVNHKCIDRSICCLAKEHKWFPMMCSNCGEFSDFICKYCSIMLYELP